MGPYTYKFLLFDGFTTRVGQNWSAVSTWTWTPLTVGPYTVTVWVRNAGSSAPFDALRESTGVTVAAGTPVTLTSFSPSPSEAAAGTPITWTPPRAGTYAFQVWVRNVGSSAAYDAWRGGSFTAVVPPGPTVTEVSPGRASPVPAGRP